MKANRGAANHIEINTDFKAAPQMENQQPAAVAADIKIHSAPLSPIFCRHLTSASDAITNM